METTIKKLRQIFVIIFVQFLTIAGIMYYLKKAEIVNDLIDISNKLTIIIPILMIASILISYVIYDRIAKSSQKIEDNEELQVKKFFTASLVKIVMLDFVGILVALMLLLLFQQTYVYMLGIIIVFFMLNFPNEAKFKKDFVNRKNSFF